MEKMESKLNSLRGLGVVFIILGLFTGIIGIMLPSFVTELTDLFIYRHGMIMGVAMSECFIGSMILFLSK